MKSELQVGDTIRLKQHLKVGMLYNGITFLENMDCGRRRLTVVGVDGSSSILLKCPDGCRWWYSFEMLDFRTIRRKKDEQSV